MADDYSWLPMMLGSLVQAGGTIASANSQAQAMESQGAYQKQQYRFNSRLAETQGKRAILRGEKAASQYRTQVKGIVGAQRASLAAQGVSVNEGSAREVQSDTRKLAAVDIMTIKNNAWQEAWGYKVQAMDLNFKGDMAASAAQFNANSTLLTGGMNALTYATKAGYYASGYTKPRYGETSQNVEYSGSSKVPYLNRGPATIVPPMER